jgi:hypothetical protein
MRLRQAERFLVMAFITEGRAGFLQSQNADNAVRFVACQALFFVKRLVFLASWEIRHRMAVGTVLLGGEP